MRAEAARPGPVAGANATSGDYRKEHSGYQVTFLGLEPKLPDLDEVDVTVLHLSDGRGWQVSAMGWDQTRVGAAGEARCREIAAKLRAIPTE